MDGNKRVKIVDAFYQEFYVSSESIEDAIKHRTVFNIIHSETGLKIDFWMLTNEEYYNKWLRFSYF